MTTTESMVDRHEALAASVMPEIGLLIGDDLVSETASGMLTRLDPATGSALRDFPIAGSSEVDRAVAAAKAAFPAWRRMPADQRRKLLIRCSQAILEHESEFSSLAALESGTPLSMNMISMPVDHFEYYAGWCDKFEGDLVSTYPRRALDYVKYEPYGVIAALVTWNGPIINAAMKISAAIAAGNTVVVRPSELAPFAVLRLGQVLLEAGLPAGVVNVISGGPETAEALIRHPDVSKVSFTGGPAVARKIMATAAESLTPLCLELGGKSANLVFEDADLDRAAAHAAFMSVVAVSGQGCNLPTRLLVQDTIYEEFLERVRSIVESQKIGDPLDSSTMMGPVIDLNAVQRIQGFIDEARPQARLLTGGERLGGELSDGYFLTPTVLADVDSASRLAQQEIFGPVLAAMPFSTEEEALAKANGTGYGLAAYLHTNDLRRAHRLADDLEAGMISVNGSPDIAAPTPFGGTKSSGFGREGGRAGIEEFVHQKNVWLLLE